MKFKSLFLLLASATLVLFTVLYVKGNGSNDDANADVSLEIVQSIDISKSKDMNFGQITLGSSGGELTLGTDGVLATTGGIEIFDDANTEPAEFTVSGESNALYTVTLPSDNEVKITGVNNSSEEIDLKTFSHNSTEELDAQGAETFQVGAIAEIDASNEVDVYQGDFTVSVDYQ